MAVPSADQLYNPLLQAIHALGGSASVAELESKVPEYISISAIDLEQIHEANRTKFSYNLAWTRTHLKMFGLLENPSRAVWSLTELGKQTKTVDVKKVKDKLKTIDLTKKNKKPDDSNMNQIGVDPEDEVAQITWETDALDALKSMMPEAFERLCQYIFRRSGFVQVEVTGRSGDGGIDGKGILKLGILSFHVYFQCKRYKDTVGAPVIRDFRGAMVGRADKGIIMTTGTFSRDAKSEALRDGATPLDLVDVDDLVRMCKELQIGIKTEQKMIEVVQVNKNYFLEF
jgi:restriction system protein